MDWEGFGLLNEAEGFKRSVVDGNYKRMEIMIQKLEETGFGNRKSLNMTQDFHRELFNYIASVNAFIQQSKKVTEQSKHHDFNDFEDEILADYIDIDRLDFLGGLRNTIAHARGLSTTGISTTYDQEGVSATFLLSFPDDAEFRKEDRLLEKFKRGEAEGYDGTKKPEFAPMEEASELQESLNQFHSEFLSTLRDKHLN